MVSGHLSASFPDNDLRLALGPETLDRVLGGGLPVRRLHEIVPGGIFQLGGAAGFALALASSSPLGGAIVWIQQHLAALEGGAPHGLGGLPFGIASSRFVIVETATAKDGLWAMEESLRCPGVAAAILELAGAGEAADLTATRRLNLAMQDHNALALLLRHQPLKGTSACATRWHVCAAPGGRDGFGGIGRTAFALTLDKNRYGPCGDWHVEWKNDERRFRAALPLAVAAPVAGRSHRAM